MCIIVFRMQNNVSNREDLFQACSDFPSAGRNRLVLHMAQRNSVSDLLTSLLAASGVGAAFGVASIHNLPIVDALDRCAGIRCIPARGEAGALNMADGYARASGKLGLAVTSTGAGAGNACGAVVEALTAGIPVLHLTGQIEVPYLDRDRAFIHETKDQLGLLQAVSKRAYRVWSPQTLLGTVREAIAIALTPPAGPVSVEIPIDVQGASIGGYPVEELFPLEPGHVTLDSSALEAMAHDLRSARRPLLWLGGGARHASLPVRRLADMGFAVVTTQHGRGTLPEDHPMSIGGHAAVAAVEDFYASSDAMLIVGSRLRGNETMNWKLALPSRLYQVDVDQRARDRNYAVSRFAVGDANEALTLLADKLDSDFQLDPEFRHDVATLRGRTQAALLDGLGVYRSLVEALAEWMPGHAIWVRDVTLANSMWGNRYPLLSSQSQNINAVGTGIGQGLPMAIGAASAVGENRKTILLTGDGGLMLCLGELATLVQERLNVLIIVMNDGGYGVIRNIQDARFGGRHFLADLETPDFQHLAQSFKIPSARVANGAAFARALSALGSLRGPALIEVDMATMGPYAEVFAGSPVRASTPDRKN